MEQRQNLDLIKTREKINKILSDSKNQRRCKEVKRKKEKLERERDREDRMGSSTNRKTDLPD